MTEISNETTTAAQAPSAGEPQGLGGWLVLLGLSLGWAILTFVLVGAIAAFLFHRFEVWSALTDQDSEFYHPALAPLLGIVLAACFIVFCFAVAALVLFFRKSPRFPKVYITYAGLSIVVYLVSLVFAQLIPPDEPGWYIPGLESLFNPALHALVGLVYVLRSTRVKKTFQN